MSISIPYDPLFTNPVITQFANEYDERTSIRVSAERALSDILHPKYLKFTNPQRIEFQGILKNLKFDDDLFDGINYNDDQEIQSTVSLQLASLVGMTESIQPINSNSCSSLALSFLHEQWKKGRSSTLENVKRCFEMTDSETEWDVLLDVIGYFPDSIIDRRYVLLPPLSDAYYFNYQELVNQGNYKVIHSLTNKQVAWSIRAETILDFVEFLSSNRSLYVGWHQKQTLNQPHAFIYPDLKSLEIEVTNGIRRNWNLMFQASNTSLPPKRRANNQLCFLNGIPMLQNLNILSVLPYPVDYNPSISTTFRFHALVKRLHHKIFGNKLVNAVVHQTRPIQSNVFKNFAHMDNPQLTVKLQNMSFIPFTTRTVKPSPKWFFTGYPNQKISSIDLDYITPKPIGITPTHAEDWNSTFQFMIGSGTSTSLVNVPHKLVTTYKKYASFIPKSLCVNVYPRLNGSQVGFNELLHHISPMKEEEIKAAWGISDLWAKTLYKLAQIPNFNFTLNDLYTVNIIEAINREIPPTGPKARATVSVLGGDSTALVGISLFDDQFYVRSARTVPPSSDYSKPLLAYNQTGMTNFHIIYLNDRNYVDDEGLVSAVHDSALRGLSWSTVGCAIHVPFWSYACSKLMSQKTQLPKCYAVRLFIENPFRPDLVLLFSHGPPVPFPAGLGSRLVHSIQEEVLQKDETYMSSEVPLTTITQLIYDRERRGRRIFTFVARDQKELDYGMSMLGAVCRSVTLMKRKDESTIALYGAQDPTRCKITSMNGVIGSFPPDECRINDYYEQEKWETIGPQNLSLGHAYAQASRYAMGDDQYSLELTGILMDTVLDIGGRDGENVLSFEGNKSYTICDPHIPSEGLLSQNINYVNKMVTNSPEGLQVIDDVKPNLIYMTFVLDAYNDTDVQKNADLIKAILQRAKTHHPNNSVVMYFTFQVWIGDILRLSHVPDLIVDYDAKKYGFKGISPLPYGADQDQVNKLFKSVDGFTHLPVLGSHYATMMREHYFKLEPMHPSHIAMLNFGMRLYRAVL
uniref:Coat protein 1 n=1 Tax=Shenzhen reo-like virus 5 TaxID=2789383 RepID=A0A7S8WJY6_9REOV|nr:coat protein 1 [Shenzhen reo-like virus 5]